jgi:hypothetical protein
MAGDALRKVAPGETLRIPAGAYNAFIDAAVDFQRRQREQGSQAKDVQQIPGTVYIRNDSGADRARYEVLGVSGRLFPIEGTDGSFRDATAVTGVVPTESSHKGRFVILVEPITAGRVGRALAVGVCPVMLSISDPTHLYADVADGSPAGLVSGESGAAAILWAASSMGTGWALVRLPAGGGGGGGEPPEIVYQ